MHMFQGVPMFRRHCIWQELWNAQGVPMFPHTLKASGLPFPSLLDGAASKVDDSVSADAHIQIQLSMHVLCGCVCVFYICSHARQQSAGAAQMTRMAGNSFHIACAGTFIGFVLSNLHPATD